MYPGKLLLLTLSAGLLLPGASRATPVNGFAAASAQSAADAMDKTPAIRLAQEERRPRRNRRRSQDDAQSSGRGASSGRYGILREKNRDVGCVLTLSGNGRAQLGPGCSDQGIVIFDPVGWQASGGRITLRARKGHRITFSSRPDGTWQRDPAGSKPLGLKKY